MDQKLHMELSPFFFSNSCSTSFCYLNAMENTKSLKKRGSHVQMSLLKQLCTCGLDVGGVVQFRALSDQLYRSPDHHKFVRSKVVFQVILYLVSFYIYCLNLFGPIRFTSQPMPDDRKCTLKI